MLINCKLLSDVGPAHLQCWVQLVSIPTGGCVFIGNLFIANFVVARVLYHVDISLKEVVWIVSFVFIMEPSYWTWTWWLKSLAIICVEWDLGRTFLELPWSVLFLLFLLECICWSTIWIFFSVFYQTWIIRYYTCTVLITHSLHCWSPSYIWKVTSFFNGVWPCYHWFQWNQGGGLLQMEMNRARLTWDFFFTVKHFLLTLPGNKYCCSLFD